MLEKPYYIYRHIRPDNDEVFYIGKGTNRRNSYSYERAHTVISRNKIWESIVSKCEGLYEVEIVMEFASPEECVSKEKEFIALYGRKDLGTGTLSNLMDGGDGSWGIIVSKELRQKRSDLVAGDKHPNWGKTLSEETRKRKSMALAGDKHFLWGTSLPDSWKESISASKLGEKNPMYGKTGPQHHGTKRVIDTETGKIYFGAREAAKAAGVSVSAMYQYLDGTRPNKTTMIREAA